MQVKKQQLELNMEQWTGSKLGKEYIKAVYCYHAYLTSMQSTSCKMLGWMKHKLESRLPGKWKWKLLSRIQLCNPMDYTVHGILQTRILEWVAFSFSIYAEYIMWNAGMDEAQAGIKTTRRNTNNPDMQMTPPLWQKVKKN